MAEKLKNPVAVLILISVLSFYLLQPLPAKAQEASGTSVSLKLIGGLACTVVGGGLSTWLVNRILDGIGKLADGLFKIGLKRLGLALMKAGLDSVPIKDNPNDRRESVLDVAARCFAREIMTDMTSRMIGAVRTSGRDGKASFVRDWRRFLTNAQHRGENVFRSMLISTTLCPHFSNDLRTVFRANNQPSLGINTRINNLDPFDRRARCTMPKGWSMDRLNTDFSGNGGWDSVLRLAQPQNNFYGVLLMSLGELAAQRAFEEKADIAETAPGGLTSRRSGVVRDPASKICTNNANKTCTTNADCSEPPGTGLCNDPDESGQFHCSNDYDRICINNSECTTLPSSGFCLPAPKTRDPCAVRGRNGQCVVHKDIITPGSVLGDAVSATMQEELAWITNVDEWNEIIQYLMTTVMSRILNLSTPSRYSQEIFDKERYSSSYSGDQYSDNIPSDPNAPQCSDGLDNDGDGLIDFPDDLECTNDSDNDESSNPPPPPKKYVPPPGTIWYSIDLQASTGHYLVARDDGAGMRVEANIYIEGGLTDFLLYDFNGGTLTNGDQVAIQSVAIASFFRAEGGGGSTLDITPYDVGPWETFVISEDAASDGITDLNPITLKTWNGINYVDAENGGGGAVMARTSAVGPWEIFKLLLGASSIDPNPPPIPTPDVPPPGPVCGDGICEPGEFCKADCGGPKPK